MTTVVDADKAIELLERAVEEKGADYVDPDAATVGCNYADAKGNPLCIVGHVVSYLGVDLRPVVLVDEGYYEREELWGHGVSAIELNYANDAAPHPGFSFTNEAIWALGRAQTMQDNGETWGEALEAAKEVA